MRRVVFACCLSGLCFVLGCATQGTVKKQHADLQERIEGVARQMAAVDSLLHMQQKVQEQRWTDFLLDHEALTRQMEQLQARLDESALRLADMNRVMDSGGRRTRPPTPSLLPAVADTSVKVDAAKLFDAQELYRMGFEDVEAKNYLLAVPTFLQFLESFSSHELADNACYWLGECYYAQKQFPEAIGAFERVLKDYPESDKAPGALLKLGYALIETKKRADGTGMLKEVVAKFPDAPEARLARDRLKALGVSVKASKKSSR